MPQSFPAGFLWGAATSSHQVEGGNVNDWSEWEKAHARRLAQEAHQLFGKLPNWETIRKEAEDPANYISGAACDHWNRYEEDFDILQSLDLNAYRFSIEWSRIEPEEGRFDQTAIEHYRAMLLALRVRGIEPIVTLWHWTNPVWLQDLGGWEDPRTITLFVRYVEKLATEFRDLVTFWMPLNEPGTIIGMGYVQGSFPPQKRLALITANRVFRHFMRAHQESYRLIHKVIPQAHVGISHYAPYTLPYDDNMVSRWLAKTIDYFRNWRFLNTVNDTMDFIGLQYYHTDHIKFAPLLNGRWGPIDVRNPDTRMSDLGWDMYPDGLYHLLKGAARYHKPIYITENGLADQSDRQREWFIRAHLKQVAQALNEGVDVRGYFHWSLLDNFEWDKGYWPKFGLVAVDRTTQTRTIRESARAYATIARVNALP